MKKKRTPKQPNKQYLYTLPDDENKIVAESLTWGSLWAIQDGGSEPKTKDEIETYARGFCVENRLDLRGYDAVCNDFQRFCDLFILSASEIYLRDSELYRSHPERWQRAVANLREQGAENLFQTLLKLYYDKFVLYRQSGKRATE